MLLLFLHAVAAARQAVEDERKLAIAMCTVECLHVEVPVKSWNLSTIVSTCTTSCNS